MFILEKPKFLAERETAWADQSFQKGNLKEPPDLPRVRRAYHVAHRVLPVFLGEDLDVYKRFASRLKRISLCSPVGDQAGQANKAVGSCVSADG